jgi:hypothetical protein
MKLIFVGRFTFFYFIMNVYENKTITYYFAIANVYCYVWTRHYLR